MSIDDKIKVAEQQIKYLKLDKEASTEHYITAYEYYIRALYEKIYGAMGIPKKLV